jgi:hypothetical protein
LLWFEAGPCVARSGHLRTAHQPESQAQRNVAT